MLYHKGGEGRLLTVVAFRLRAAGVSASVWDLNTFVCPKIDVQLRQHAVREWAASRSRCGPGVHSQCHGPARRWMAHCPQIECIVMARWVGEHLIAVPSEAGPIVERLDPIEMPAAVRLVSACLVDLQAPLFQPPSMAGTKAHTKRRNWARAQLARHGEYLAEASMDELVTKVECALRACGENY